MASLVPEKGASMEEKRRLQKARAQKFGVEELEGQGESLTFPSGYPTNLDDYGDPVNLKFPLVPDARARNARARFKQFADTYRQASSKRIVHERIVARLLKIGAKPLYNPDDPLDKLLPASMRDKMNQAAKKLEVITEQVLVQKSIDLGDGEELQDFVRKVINSVTQQRLRMDRSIGLVGIYNSHVILRDFENNKFFKMDHTRDGEGIALSNLTEVRQTFVPVPDVGEGDEKVEKSEGPPEMELVKIQKEENFWAGVLQ